jgi:hypothetical protein
MTSDRSRRRWAHSKQSVRELNGFSWLRIGLVSGSYIHGNELSDSLAEDVSDTMSRTAQSR